MSKSTLSTDEAFDHLLDQAYLWHKTGRPQQQRSSYKNKLKSGINLTVSTKYQILKEAGYEVVQEMAWEIPCR